MKLFLYSFGVFLFFISACYTPENNEPVEIPSPYPTIERDEPKEIDPIKQKGCRAIGRNDCEGSKKCKEACNDIFSKKADRQDCYEFSEDLVFQMEDLISATEDGDVDEIDAIGPEVLECMLDIDERPFAKAIKDMSRREAKEFALLVLESEAFAQVLESEDDEFNILKQLFNKMAGGSDLETALSEEIEGDKTFLWLAAEGNEYAWEWMDNYADEKCDGQSSSDCPGGENIGAYCKALNRSLSRRKKDWQDFLSDAELFAEEYEEDVGDYGYEYDITDDPRTGYDGDFRNYCVAKILGLAPSTCPLGVDRDKRSQTFGTFTLSSVPVGGQAYYHSDYRNSEGRDFGAQGSVTDSSGDVLAIKLQRDDGGYRLVRVVMKNQDVSDGRYYFYLGDKRAEVITGNGGSDSYTEGGVRHKVFTLPLNSLGPLYRDVDRVSVWLTVEQDGDCNPYAN